MNILIPHQWLLEHLETTTTPEDIQAKVSLCGPSVERIYDRIGDQVYDIEVTTNRVDSMSVRGIAREVAVILNQFGDKAQLKDQQLPKPATPSADQQLPFPKVTGHQKYCKRVMGVILKDVNRAATPEWMAKRLEQIEINVHDAVIDISNYITHELGHPCHAFDYDKVMALGGELMVTEAQAGDVFTTLDGESYEAVGGEVVFKNPAGEIIDLPAIKGTANSSISDTTKNVLLWIESLDAKKVRFASMTHAIRTVAAQLNEKNVDPHLAEPVLLRGIQLYQELCGATVASEIYDDFPGKKKLAPVEVKIATVHQYLGIELPLSEVKDILTALGCQINIAGEVLHVTPPTFRPDITIPADVVEEIARIYGYHKLPSTLMDTPIPTNKPTDTNYVIENRVKRFLAAIGWQEVYTYSMVSEAIALQSGLSLDHHLKIQNPLTDDRVYLRRSLLPSLEEILDTNQQSQLSVFELAMVYEPKNNDIPQQTLHLSIVGNGEYRQVKGILESLFDQFFVAADYQPIKQPQTQFTYQASIMVDGQNLGTIGVLKSGRVGIDISMETLVTVAKTHPTYQPLPKTGFISEDLTFTLPEQTAVGEILTVIRQVDNLVESVDLKDTYQQNFTFSIRYHDPESNLTVEVVAPIRAKMVAIVEDTFGAKLVGALQ
jgi:phenylalanyl-tRNA synthetase beta chain